jgi:hypothetical protein
MEIEPSYEIVPCPAEMGGGWRLRLLENDNEVGGRVFPVDTSIPALGVEWWNGVSQSERAYWTNAASSAVPADAWRACLLAEAYASAESEAYDWLDSREK